MERLWAIQSVMSLASEKKLKGTTWHSYSIFITDDLPTFGQGYSHMSLAQFHGSLINQVLLLMLNLVTIH